MGCDQQCNIILLAAIVECGFSSSRGELAAVDIAVQLRLRQAGVSCVSTAAAAGRGRSTAVLPVAATPQQPAVSPGRNTQHNTNYVYYPNNHQFIATKGGTAQTGSRAGKKAYPKGGAK